MAVQNATDKSGMAGAMTALALLATAACGSAYAAAPQLDGEAIDLAADVVHLDPRKGVGELSGNVRISQGDLSMEAQKATASGMQSDNSRWTFEKSVHIRTADADLKSDSASASFANGQIAEAVAQGVPATFEQRNAAADKQVRGRANTIEYDFGKGTVKLSDNVWFAQGGNEFRGDTLIYYVRDERVVMNPGGEQSGRVNITIRPRNGTKKPDAAPAAPKNDGESGA